MNFFIKLAAMVLVTISFNVVADTMQERTKPVGSVCMAGEDCAKTKSDDAAATTAGRSGQAVYDSKCASCHATGAANAPKLGDTAAWSARIAKGSDALYTSALSGFGAMPPKGLCFDCSDAEIKATVDYMVEGSK